MKACTIFLVLLLCCSFLPAKSGKQIFQENRDGICLVTFYHNISNESKIGAYNKVKKSRIGIIVNTSGLVMVNADIYPISMDIASEGNGSLYSGKPSEFKVKLSDKTEYDAEFLGKDDQAQVAFIQIQNLPAELKLQPIQFSINKNLSVADEVYLLELLPAAYNFEPVFFATNINAVLSIPWRRFILKEARTSLSYGGLVLDNAGKAVGITVRKNFDFTPLGQYSNSRNFLEVFPSEVFTDLIKNPPIFKLEQTSTKRSWLGIRMQALNAELAKHWGIPQNGGIILNRIMPESPAEKAGLKSGDVLLSINGTKLTSQKDEELSEIRTLIRKIEPGEKAKFRYWRNGKIHQRTIKLAPAPKSISLAEKHILKEIGLEIRELTHDILFEENLPINFAGVFVFQVDRASVCGLAGLQIGDIITHINNKPVKNLGMAKKIFAAELAKNKQNIMLQLTSRKETRFVFISMKNG